MRLFVQPQQRQRHLRDWLVPHLDLQFGLGQLRQHGLERMRDAAEHDEQLWRLR